MNDNARQKLQRRRVFKLVLTPFLIALFGFCLYRAVLYYWEQDYGTLNAVLSHLEGDAVTFSEPDGVYNDSMDLTLTMHSDLSEEARIYYTLDGSDPGSDSDTAEKYFAPVHLTADTQAVTMVTVKACVRWKGESSPVQTHYYLIARDAAVYETLQDIYVAAITSSEESLYDYETGILADGRYHDDALAQRQADPTAPDPEGIGNWSQEGDEWIRAVHLALFSPDGSLLLEQPAGMAVSGHVSRRRSPVSLTLLSGNIFEQAWSEGITGVIPALTEPTESEEDLVEEDSRFITALFHDSAEDTLSFVKKYRKIRLRSMNQLYRNFQTPFFFRIARESGLAGVAPTRTALVLLNEEIHSIADLQPNYTGGWLARRFYLPDSSGIEKVKGSDEEILEQMGVLDLFHADLNREANRKALEADVDMEDMLLYYAVEILADNRDWPQGNCEAWRWTLPEAETDSPYADGRIRFLLFDVDHIYQSSKSAVSTFRVELLTRLMGNQEGVFASLMRSDVYRNRFLTIVCDLMDTCFRTEHLLNVYDEAYMKYRQQLMVFNLMDKDALSSLDNSVEGCRNRIADREEVFRSLIQSLLLEPEEAAADDTLYSEQDLIPYRIDSSQGLVLHWGARSLTGEGTAKGSYYADCDVTLSASPGPGQVWDGWTVNGRSLPAGDSLLSEDGLQLNLGALLKQYQDDGSVGGNTARRPDLTIRASAHPAEIPSLVISEVSSKDGRDWVTLCNAGSTPVSLGDYQVFNTRTQAYNDLPNKTLESGGEIRLCSKQSMLAQVGGGLLSFRIREGDGIYLLRKDSAEVPDSAEQSENTASPEDTEASGPTFPHSTAVDHVTVPRMCDGEVYARTRDTSGAVTAFYIFRISENAK